MMETAILHGQKHPYNTIFPPADQYIALNAVSHDEEPSMARVRLDHLGTAPGLHVARSEQSFPGATGPCRRVALSFGIPHETSPKTKEDWTSFERSER